MEVKGVGFADQPTGLAELENAEAATGFEDAMEFAEAGFVVGEIAEAECGDDEIEGLGTKREVERVRFESDGARAVRLRCAEFLHSAAQHGMGEIGG